MGKTIDAANIKYLYMDGIALLTGYVLSISAEDDTFYIANNKNITLTYNSVPKTFNALAIKRTPIRSEDGTILNEVEIGLDNVDLAFKNDVMLGKFNNRRCKVILVFAQKGSTSGLGYMTLYMGYLDEPKGDENWVTMQIRPFSIFEREFPNRIFQVGCNWTFCDNNCTLELSDYWVDTTLGSDSSGTTLVCAHGKAANYFTPGFVKITSGDYSGAYRPILSNDTSSVTCRIPFPYVISAGTSIRVQKLCARVPSACINTFNNYTNYGGFPHVPKSPII
jgi:uncharacterized phage protein (TIGR02218 family)